MSADSFRTMGVAVTQGRAFTDADGLGAPLVVVVNATYAREHFDEGGPLGRTIGLVVALFAMVAILGTLRPAKWATSVSPRMAMDGL